MSTSTRVLLVDDHPLMRSAVRDVLSRADGIEVVGEAGSGKAAMRAIKESRPDVVLLDLFLPDVSGIQLLADITRAHDCHVIILSANSEARFVRMAIDGGASGYLAKSAEPRQIVSAVRDVGRGNMPLSSEASTALIATMQKTARADRPEITAREREVWRHLAGGASNTEIAEQMFISVHTVKFHTQNLFRKLGFKNRYEAASAAHWCGLDGKPSP